MHKNSLLEIVRTFTPKELIKFEDFLKSPYHNKNKQVVNLFFEIKKYAPEFIDEELGKEFIWNKLFPGEKYNYGKMKNLIHDHTKLIVKFIELENYDKNKNESNLNVIEQYKSRGLLTLFKKKLRENKDELSKLNADTNSYYYIHKSEIKVLELLSLMHNVKELNNFDFSVYNKNLSRYFYSMFFEINSLACEISFLYNNPLDKEGIDRIIKSYEEWEYKDYFTDIEYHAFKTVYDPMNEDNYYRLKELYYKNFDKLSKRNKYLFAVALINFCKNNSNTGNLFFIKERYQYNKLIADKELLFFGSNKYIDRYIFMSIVIAACTAGEFEWCERFIKKYESNLENEVRIQTVNFAYTHLNFKNKNYEKSLAFLSKCKNAIGMDKINIKTYECFLYYELEYLEELKHLSDTCRHFAKNDKTISNASREQFVKFVNIVNRLSDYRYNLKNKKANEYDLEVIKKNISGNQMAGKNWLMEKISELEK